jgi:tRNA(fMet)-specific endonuclease VapC
MIYLLDSNVVIAVLKGKRGVIEKLESIAMSDVAISALVVHELYYGAYKSQRRTDNLAVLDRLQFQVLDFDREDAVCAGQIRADLVLMGKPSL